MTALELVVALLALGVAGAVASTPAPAAPSPTLVFVAALGDEGGWLTVPAGFQLAELRAELADTDAAR